MLGHSIAPILVHERYPTADIPSLAHQSFFDALIRISEHINKYHPDY